MRLASSMTMHINSNNVWLLGSKHHYLCDLEGLSTEICCSTLLSWHYKIGFTEIAGNSALSYQFQENQQGGIGQG